eukprot:TRINITY_DN567_c0_g2_i1.p1 TRINITY_DN567_c0_g2~~TRINITY_DN567_c0_g2_i1.p1  ORF type:complete len:420 (+),score=142.60 TRINITY_DN567_c0_g2_i1:32-1291(+)
MEMFPSPEDIISFVNKDVLKDSGEFSLDDIKKKNIPALVKVYDLFLLSLGLSEEMFQTQFNALMENAEPEVDELLRDEDRKLKLVSLLSWVMDAIEVDGIRFSYDDISNPDETRTIHFLGNLMNFLLFANERKNEDAQLEYEIARMKAEKDDLLDRGQLINSPEKDKREFKERFEAGLKELEMGEAREDSLRGQVEAVEHEGNEAEERYNQGLESKGEAEKVISTIEQIVQLHTRNSQINAEMKSLDDDVINLKRYGWEQYKPVMQADQQLSVQQEEVHLKSIIEEQRAKERGLARDEKQLDKNNADLEQEMENIKDSMNTNMSKFKRKKEMQEKHIETLTRDLAKLSQNQQNTELQEILSFKQNIVDQMGETKADVLDAERRNDEFIARLNSSLETFSRKVKSELKGISESARNLPGY